MTQFRKLVLTATAGSMALLLGAFAFQYLGNMAPCKLCIWQRWPHAVAAVIGGLCLVMTNNRALPLLGALAALSSAGVGGYHTGVEKGWWQGPSTCTSGPISELSTDELMAQILAAPLVRCDEIAWEFLTLSMASWNAVISLGLALVWVLAARAKS